MAKRWVMTPARRAYYDSKGRRTIGQLARKKSAGFKKAYSAGYKSGRRSGLSKQFSRAMGMTAGREFKTDYEQVRRASNRASTKRRRK